MSITAPIDKALREEVFLATAQRMNISETVIEKDYWVCWTLNYLFNQSRWKGSLIFKGGTCLSKCFNLIKRFSEDIDLVLDWSILGYGLDEPYEQRSKTQQDLLVKELRRKSNIYLANTMTPEIQRDFDVLISEPFSLIHDTKTETIFFEYPHSFENSGLLNMIRLEIGALSAISPNQGANIQSYASEYYPQIFGDAKIPVQVISPLRTFWEKITILHKAAYFSQDLFPERYSRHYYDVGELCRCDIKDQAIHNTKLMNEVVEFNQRFYPKSTYHFEMAKPGSFKLIPDIRNIPKLEKDYRAMEMMFFDSHPTFDELMEQIKNLELELNLIR